MKNKSVQNIIILTLSLGGFFVWTKTVLAATAGDVIVNEIAWMGTTVSANDEWIELYNTTASDIALDGWTLNALDEAPTITLSGTIPGNGYFLLERTDDNSVLGIAADQIYTGAMGNNGEHFELRDAESVLIDSIESEEGWSAGDNEAKQTMERAANGSWQTSAEAGGTPKATNSVGYQSEPEPEELAPTFPGQSGSSTPSPRASPSEALVKEGDPTKLKISEVFPNPEADQNQEFIELWNSGALSISLEGWRLADEAKVITLQDIVLVPGEYRPLYRSTTNIALNNTSESVKLYSATGDLIDELSYEKTIRGQSYGRSAADETFAWTDTRTPGSVNVFTSPSAPPVPVITFKHNPVAPGEHAIIFGLDSFDPDEDPLSYFWTIGGDARFQASGPSFAYVFSALGEYVISLTVSDGRHNAVATSVIGVMPAIDVVSGRIAASEPVRRDTTHRVSTDEAATLNSAVTSAKIYITEIFPNPPGSDDAEWIELYNPNDVAVSLEGWSIDDSEGGSKPHVISGKTIAAGEFILLERSETKIALNNTNDEVQLFDAGGTIIDYVFYDKVKEGQSYAKTESGAWVWTEETTPGYENEIGVVTIMENSAQSSLPAWSGEAATNAPFALDDSYPVDIDLANVRELELGTEVRVQGTVAVPPGVLAKTYFYITGSPGIQVYYSRSDWPDLAVGDVIGVFGVLTETGGERRLKVSAKEDVVPLYAGEPPEPEKIETGAVGEATEGWLVSVTGELLEKKGNSWYMDDGSGEIRVTFQTSADIKKPAVKAGEWIAITGLVSQTASGYRILPRFQDDVNIVAEEEVAELAESGTVLGAETNQDAIQRFRIPENNKSQEIFTYLLITSAALIALLAGLLIKLRIETRKRLKELEERIKG